MNSHRFVPSFLKPEFTWPHQKASSVPLATPMPATPSLTRPWIRRIVGTVHIWLVRFSRIYYCKWTGIRYNNQIVPLPFGLILKRSDGTKLEEVLAMKIARAAGLPVPRVISYGDHPEAPHAPVSILMTRIPGDCLNEVFETLSDEIKHTLLNELSNVLQTMRSWSSPWGDKRICSITGGPVRSLRTYPRSFGPFESEAEFNKMLLSFAQATDDMPEEEFELVLDDLRQTGREMNHRIVFTHGDFKLHNCMYYDGHISAVIDWECAAWLPEYWEFTTASKFIPKSNYDFIQRLGGKDYSTEMEHENTLQKLTIHVWTGW